MDYGVMYDLMLVLVQGGFKLGMALLAIVALSLTLIQLNRLTGNRFDETLSSASPDVRLGYFAVRLLGYAILVGLAIS